MPDTMKSFIYRLLPRIRSTACYHELEETERRVGTPLTTTYTGT